MLYNVAVSTKWNHQLQHISNNFPVKAWYWEVSLLIKFYLISKMHGPLVTYLLKLKLFII